MPRSSFLVLLVLKFLETIHDSADAFTPRISGVAFCQHRHIKFESRQGNTNLCPKFLSAVPRYGPPSSVDGADQNGSTQPTDKKSQPSIGADKIEFQRLVDQVMKISKPEHVPRLLANNLELIMGLQGEEGAEIISSILEDAESVSNKDDDDDTYALTLQSVEMILSFTEDFVGQAQEMDTTNKELLGKILKVIVAPGNDQSVSGEEGKTMSGDNAKKREEALDKVMKEEKKNFTAGFLRHLEGECYRITNQSKVTTESAKLLEILRLIQTRVLEEIGQDLGEAGLVLGQLMGYEKEEELLGVLDAGLTVRGNDFALEMASLTEEALDGFSRVPGGADPELIEKVRFIDRRLQEFLTETKEFQ